MLPKLQRMAELARSRWSAGQGQFAELAAAGADAVEVERLLLALRAEHAVGRARLAERIGTRDG